MLWGRCTSTWLCSLPPPTAAQKSSNRQHLQPTTLRLISSNQPASTISNWQQPPTTTINPLPQALKALYSLPLGIDGSPISCVLQPKIKLMDQLARSLSICFGLGGEILQILGTDMGPSIRNGYIYDDGRLEVESEYPFWWLQTIWRGQSNKEQGMKVYFANHP